MNLKISQEDFDKLRDLEESLWRSETRFDLEYMNQILASDFFEFGRSGRIYRREDTLGSAAEEFDAQLLNFDVHLIDSNVALVTYLSQVTYDDVEIANRSSIWSKTVTGWQIRFHQGTPVTR